MQQSAPNRKRPAPGTSPPVQQPPMAPSAYPFQPLPDSTDFSNIDFSSVFGNDQMYPPTNLGDSGEFAYNLNAPQPAGYRGTPAPSSSTDLIRRSHDQQLAPQGMPQEQWNGFGNMNGQVEDEDEQDLDVKVALAKRDAQRKRKQIPPFVQKLSSFLDSNNTDLIRWSDDGRSFIVVDEDEFARTLIPELFKHNNYASFVRQLNMYGFHKTVNITDGSLRQSEKARKGVKPPSMYSHPYFRKNRPDLLWLVQKPSGKTNAKRKRDGTLKDGDSDDERQYSPSPEEKPLGELSGVRGAQDLAPMPRTELAAVRTELKKLQQQQNIISRMIGQLKEQNDQFYRQATAFQALHDRHENSINAILTFLATFYNRSLEGHAGQNLVNMFSNAAQNNPQQGSVVEEYNDTPTDSNNQIQRFPKRPPLLLPGPSAVPAHRQQLGEVLTEPNSERPSESPPRMASSTAGKPDPKSTATSGNTASSFSGSVNSPVIKDDAPTPNTLSQIPEKNNDEMMSLINSVNATNASTPTASAAPAVDFSSALDHFQTANGNAPLTPQQRDNMLAMIANQQQQQRGSSHDSSNNNALISPTPPTMPDLSRLKETQQQLEMLTNLQKQQDAKVQDLHRRLQPLSPTGTIPGLAGGGNADDSYDFTGAPGDFDPNTYFNFDDSWGDGDDDGGGNFDFGGTGGDGGGDWDFENPPADDDDLFSAANIDPTAAAAPTDFNHLAVPLADGPDSNGGGGGGRVESLSNSSVTSPAATIGTHEDAEAEGEGNRKRARRT